MRLLYKNSKKTFMFQMIKYNFVYLILLPLANFILLQLFVSSFYLLYFILIFALSFFIYKNQKYLDNKKLYFYILYWIFVYMLVSYLEDFLYDIYIDFDFTFVLSYMPLSIVVILSLIHISILFLLGYNKRR